MIDKKGYRKNVGIIIINKNNNVFWCRRIGQKSWQFPQGGVDESESLIDAMYRELWEETGLKPKHVDVISETVDWLAYDLPKHYQRKNTHPRCIGQKQKWFLLRLLGDENDINFNQSKKAEFDAFRWVDYWYPIRQVIYFKRHVYRSALNELCKEIGISPRQSTARQSTSSYWYHKKKRPPRQHSKK